MAKYTIEKQYKYGLLIGEFIIRNKRYKIYQLPEKTLYQGFTFAELLEYLNELQSVPNEL